MKPRGGEKYSTLHAAIKIFQLFPTNELVPVLVSASSAAECGASRWSRSRAAFYFCLRDKEGRKE